MDIIKKIKSLYDKLPEVGCTGCGLCCVSPTSTLSEFIYLINYLEENFTDKEIINFISMKPKLHEKYEGNSCCSFLDKTRCLVHPGRTGACRLFGIPALKDMGIQDMEECKHNIEIVSGRGDLPYIETWLNELFELESTLYTFAEEPYFIKGFNIHCWLDIFFDTTLDFDIFLSLKNIIKDYTNLNDFKKYHSPQTGLREKIDKIGIFNSMIGTAEAETLKSVLISIRDDYPLTGTYFFEEANEYLKTIDSNL